jgi:hypothetical protein
MKLVAFNDRFGSWMRFLPVDRDTCRGEREFWRATADVSGTLWFQPPDVPIQVWAVTIQPAGVIWGEAEVERITERNVIVRYAGETARLDREKLWRSWALWRGVLFVSSRSGRAANLLDAIWQDRWERAAGGVPPVMRMALAEAIALLGVAANYTKEDVIAAFRRAVKKAHPDAGGTAEMFQKLVKARDRLLASIGDSAPAPTPPSVSTRRRNQSLPNPRLKERDLGKARQMSSPQIHHQRRLEGIREPIPYCGFPTATRMPP